MTLLNPATMRTLYMHLIAFLLASVQVTHARSDSNANSDGSPIQVNFGPQQKSDPSPASTPEPTRRLFTAAAFQSPWPPKPGGLSGSILRVEGGTFWFDPWNSLPSAGCGNSSDCPPGYETVLWVDRYSQAWLVSWLLSQVPDPPY